MEHLHEPSPYDHIQNMHTDIVPDLLVFSKPLLNLGLSEMSLNMNNMGQMGTIASDSCTASAASDSRPSSCSDLSNDVLNTMTQAMYNLTTSNDKEQTRKQIRDSLMDVTNNEGNNIIHIAVINRQLEALKLIIDMVDKIDIGDVLDEPNRIGSSALHLAVETNQLEAVRMLLASKAYPNKLDRDGDTAVHIAIRENSVQILQTLLQHQVSNQNMKTNIRRHFFRLIQTFLITLASFPFILQLRTTCSILSSFLLIMALMLMPEIRLLAEQQFTLQLSAS